MYTYQKQGYRLQSLGVLQVLLNRGISVKLGIDIGGCCGAFQSLLVQCRSNKGSDRTFKNAYA